MRLFRIIIMIAALVALAITAHRLSHYLDTMGYIAVWFCVLLFLIEVIEDAARYAEDRFNRGLEIDVSDMLPDMDDEIIRELEIETAKEVHRLNMEAKV